MHNLNIVELFSYPYFPLFLVHNKNLKVKTFLFLFTRPIGDRMEFIVKKVMIVILISFIITFPGCSKENSSNNQYDLENFESDMNNKGYDFEIQDVPKDFLPTTRKRMEIDETALDIYLFGNNKKMESEASNIDSDGFGYDNWSGSVKISWVSYPHFYKRGSIIVQYIGEDETLLSDLTEILGEQFAGQEQQ